MYRPEMKVTIRRPGDHNLPGVTELRQPHGLVDRDGDRRTVTANRDCNMRVRLHSLSWTHRLGIMISVRHQSVQAPRFRFTAKVAGPARR